MNDAIVVQRPLAASTSPAELLLLFHGVGSCAEDLLPLGRALAVPADRVVVPVGVDRPAGAISPRRRPGDVTEISHPSKYSRNAIAMALRGRLYWWLQFRSPHRSRSSSAKVWRSQALPASA